MKRRMVLLFGCFCVCFTALYLWIAALMTDPFYREAGARQSQTTLTVPTARGTIYDTHRTPLTNKGQSFVAFVHPTPDSIALLLEISPAPSAGELMERLQAGKPFTCEVTTDRISHKDITVVSTTSRYNPAAPLPHVIGFVESSTGQGVSGIEQAFDELLTEASQSVSITYTVDGKGRPYPNSVPSFSQSGQARDGVVLTLDATLQSICQVVGEQHIDRGSIVVMDGQNGALRAVCSFPSFSYATLAEDLNDTESSPMLNRAFHAASVGSVFKLVVAAGALEQGWESDQSYRCVGRYPLEPEDAFHCHDLAGHGKLTLRSGLMKSCNPFFIHLGLQQPPTSLLRMANDLSFGKPTVLAPTLYTDGGLLPTQETLQNPAALANLSFGQGELLATPIQIAQMMGSILNGGITPTAYLVEGTIQNGDFHAMTPQTEGIAAMGADTARLLREDLVDCVMGQEGQNACPSTVSAGGKTATAQTGVFVEGEEQYQGWFAGFFPAQSPRYVVVVTVEEAKSGNADAAPVFAELADRIAAHEGLCDLQYS